jgi:hypothetical protein
VETGPLNLVRALFDPAGMRQYIVNGDEVDAAVRELTGRGAHLHPALYRKLPDENHDQVR